LASFISRHDHLYVTITALRFARPAFRKRPAQIVLKGIRRWKRIASHPSRSIHRSPTEMLDPIPPPAPYLFRLVKPYADALYLPTLPYHVHEVIFAFFLYQTTQSLVSPVLSTFFFPNIYPRLNRRTRLNWDVHVVSLLQSCLINALGLWVMIKDAERYDMKSSVLERIYGYTGASGLIQALATGYFLWDLVVSARYVKIFGPGILAHAITALSVFFLGFVRAPFPARRRLALTGDGRDHFATTTDRSSSSTNYRPPF